MNSLGMPAILSGGIEIETMQISPNDMSLVDLSRHNDSRIAVMLGVPPVIVGLPSGADSMTYNNMSAAYDDHWRSGLSPLVEAITSALSGWALPNGTDLEVNKDDYVRPDAYTRAQTQQIYVAMGALHPGDPRGLRAELKITDFTDGNDVLALAEDGLLSASVGFRPISEEWDKDRTTVKVTRAQLVHIALTGDPAYQGAKVLAVRTDDGDRDPVPTPNLDRLRLTMLARSAGFDISSDL
jgi:hypothetical protein